MTTQEVAAKTSEAWAWLIAIGGHWVLISAVVNLLLRAKKAEAWVANAEAIPVMSLGIRILRALGVDPAALLRGGATVASAKAAGTTAGRVVSGFFPPSEGQGSEPPPPTPRPGGGAP